MKKLFFLKSIFYAVAITTVLTIAGCSCDRSKLVGNIWVLTDYGPKDATVAVLEPSPTSPGMGEITLKFDGNNVNGKDGCNSYFGVFSQSACAFSVDSLKNTLIACSPEIMTQASTYLGILKSVEKFNTANNKLRLCTGDDRILVYRKQ